MKKRFSNSVTDKIDLFPEPVITTNIDGSSKISSKTGAFFTIILIAILASYTGFHIQTMISYS